MSVYTRLAETDEQEYAISVVETWLEDIGKKVVGYTTIGKRPQAVILDLTYHGNEIYIDKNGFEDERSYAGVVVNDIKINSEDDFETFESAI